MRPVSIILTAMVFVAAFASQLYAYGEYYIEIGGEMEEEEAVTQWKKLTAKYPKVLGGLEFYPTTIVHKQDNRITTRIQAGPLGTKLDAYRICGKLFNDNLACFVVEGMNHQGNTARATRQASAPKKKPAVLPWLVKQQPSEEARPIMADRMEAKEDEDLFDWILSGFSSDDEPQPMLNESSAPYRQGKVEVAEAIRVPVGSEMQKTPNVAFNDKVAARPAKPLAVHSKATTGLPEGAGWLSIKHFKHNNEAIHFWQAVRAQDPVQTAGLNVRVIQPLKRRSQPDTSLLVGPFSDPRNGRKFCHTVIQTKNQKLQCGFISEDQVAGHSTKLAAAPYSHGDRYRQRRKELHAQQSRERYVSRRRPQSERVYWLHVATAQTQMQALENWDKLRHTHADLLDGLRSSVSSTLSKRSKYMLRIGPLDSGSAAAELCSSLKQRRVPCRVYSNM